MFESEKTEWDSLFKYYQDRFLEEIGICFACVKNEKFLFEIDFYVGEKTKRVVGMRLYQEIANKKTKDSDDSHTVYYDFALSKENKIGKLFFKEIIEKPGSIIEEDTEKDVQIEFIEVKVFSEDGTSNSNITYITIAPKNFPDKILYFSDVSYD